MQGEGSRRVEGMERIKTERRRRYNSVCLQFSLQRERKLSDKE
jgi:hypothetical protein